MSRRDDRLAEQAREDREIEAIENRRPNVPPAQIPESERCPAQPWRRCDFTMKFKDQRSCWYCCRPKPTAAKGESS